MKNAGSLEYACARLHARHARRPSEAQWERIEHARGFAAALRLARDTPLGAAWGALGPDPDPHAVDSAFRAAWDRVVAECAAWSPESLVRAIEWCAVLSRIAALAYRASGGERVPWAASDAQLGSLSPAGEPVPRDPALSRLVRPGLAPEAMLEGWLGELRRRLPDSCGDDPGMRALGREFARHRDLLRRATPAEAIEARRSLGARLRTAFRRHGTEPAGIFAWLALEGLDLERLRGELARRAALPDWALAP